jgi:VanZ family protein
MLFLIHKRIARTSHTQNTTSSIGGRGSSRLHLLSPHTTSMTHRMRKYLDIPLTLMVGLALTVAMLWPLDTPPPAPEGSDKLVHLIAFAALAFPLARTGRLGLFSVLIGASAFGGAIELIQPMFNRSADVNDWIADTVGVLIGIGCGLAYRRLRKR